MSTYVGIGEFSRLTHLSVKTLHHYHAVGLLEPSAVDEHTAYRRYGLDQVDRAHLIRRLRDLDMPIPEVAAVLEADGRRRERLLHAHLSRLQEQLERTSAAVTSLRDLLEGGWAPPVSYREVAAQPALAIRASVRRDDIEAWCGAAFARLGALAASRPRDVRGDLGATYAEEFFTAGAGEVLAFRPASPGAAPEPGLELIHLPGGRFAIARHDGSYADVDRTYGRLGSHVAERDESRPGAIREIYLVGPGDTSDPARFRTDICWPVQPTPN